MNVVATKSKKAARIESTLLNKLAMMGQKTFAKAMGVPEYRKPMEERFLLSGQHDACGSEYGIEDEEMAELTRRLATYLTKKKPRRTANSSRPDVERLDQSTGVIMPNSSVLTRTNYTKTYYVIGSYPASNSLVDFGLSWRK